MGSHFADAGSDFILFSCLLLFILRDGEQASVSVGGHREREREGQRRAQLGAHTHKPRNNHLSLNHESDT